MKIKTVKLLLLPVMFTPCFLHAQENAKASASVQALADKLANPVANMISVPLQNNSDWGIGPYNGSKNTLNIQPVIPFQLNAKMNLITRYILPVVSQRDVVAAGSNQFGLSDLTVSAWFSPSTPKNGVIWGAGPAFLFPTATSSLLGTQKLGVGPTALLLKQANGNTFGFLANQLWSIAGNDSRANVSQLFLQPFFAHNFPSGAGIGANMELTQNWQAHTTLLFLNPIINGITKIGKQPVQLIIGPRIPLAGPGNVKPAFGVRSVLIFVF